MLIRLHHLIIKTVAAFSFVMASQAWAQTTETNTKAATAQQPDIAVMYFLDATGKKTAEEIEQTPAADFATFNPAKPIAIKDGALWLRFSVTNQTAQQGLRLILPMATLDEASLFNRSAEGAWIKQLGGDTRPISSWTQPGRYPSFVLSDDRGRAVQYLLQLRHERGLYSTLPRVVNESTFITSRQDEHLVLGMYFGLAALVVVLALTRALVYRDAGFASYAIYVALLALTIATVSGIAGLYLWPEWPFSTVMSPVLASLTGVAADWFIRVVTRPKRFSVWLDRALIAMMIISPLGGLLTIFQPSGWGYTIYSALILLNTLVMFSAIVGALWQGDHDSRWVAFGFLPIVFAILVPLLRNFGLIPASAWTELAIPVASALEVIILFYGLHARVSQRRSVETRVTRLLQVDPLTGLDTRHALIKKLGSVLSTARYTKQAYAVLLIRLANFEMIETKYGREAADRALVMAASCLRGAMYAGDVLARADVNQFALLLESPVTEPEAKAIATKVLADALRFEANKVGDRLGDVPEAQKLKFHIAVGYPSQPIGSIVGGAQAVVEKLIAAANEIEEGSQKTIRTVNVS